MCRMQCLLVLVALSINLVKCWDFAVTNGDQLEFYTNGTKTSEGLRFRKLTALAYDAVHNMLLFVDQQNDNASIFSYHIAIKKFQPLVRKRKIVEDIQGLTFDPITSTLFWTDVTERSIYSFSLAPKAKNNPYGNLLFKMDVEKPRSIAVDSCRGYIYWSNININNPTIERARFDGTDREIIISKKDNLYMPVSITIDQQSGRLYWVDDEEGIHYSIRSSDLDGSHINVELKAQRHKPNSLTVSNSSLYWIDLDNEKLWKLPKNSNNTVEPEDIVNFQDKQPYDIVANYRIEDQTTNVTECEDLARLTQKSTVLNEYTSTISEKEGLYCLHGKTVNGRMLCECTPGYSGDRCQTSVCQNYCLQGDCSVTAEGNPVCRCKDGFSGQRCDVDRCNNYCLNDATCAIDPVNKVPVCTCQKDHEGMRCEVTLNDKQQTFNDVVMRKEETEPCNCTEDKSAVVETCDAWDPVRDPIMMVLGIVSGVLCVVCAVLVTKILQLKKRPRIKKRIIVNKNVTPLTARPDQCEITIENCCNMNICETPCFEPRSTIRPTLLDSKPGKEEKRNLISNMEQPDDF